MGQRLDSMGKSYRETVKRKQKAERENSNGKINVVGRIIWWRSGKIRIELRQNSFWCFPRCGTFQPYFQFKDCSLIKN